jgi:IclR family pca regulon transcriptional regulator
VAPAAAENLDRASDEFVQALARGLAVICVFGEGAEELNLSQVASRAGLTRAGARRLLLTLKRLGHVGQRGRAFFLTPHILELGYAYLSSMPLWRFAEPILEELATSL